VKEMKAFIEAILNMAAGTVHAHIWDAASSVHHLLSSQGFEQEASEYKF